MTAQNLLADLDQRGVTIKAHGNRLRYSPRSGVTPDLMRRMKDNKAALLSLLSCESRDDLLSAGLAMESTPIKPLICRCGSIGWQDVVLRHPPHNGASTRRDCAGCGRFLDFPRWHDAT